jgi:hypothetical protein
MACCSGTCDFNLTVDKAQASLHAHTGLQRFMTCVSTTVFLLHECTRLKSRVSSKQQASGSCIQTYRYTQIHAYIQKNYSRITYHTKRFTGHVRMETDCKHCRDQNAFKYTRRYMWHVHINMYPRLQNVHMHANKEYIRLIHVCMMITTYTHTYIHAIHKHVRMYIHTDVHRRVRTLHAYYIHTYRLYIRACTVYIHTYVRTYIQEYKQYQQKYIQN